MKITAHHAHVYPPNESKDASVSRLLRLLDECEIDEAVCFAPFRNQLAEDKQMNEWLAEQIGPHANLYGFGTIDFEREDIQDQVKRIHDLGFKGIKLHPAYQQFNILSPKALEVYEQSEKLGLFLTFHTGIHWHRIKDYDVSLFDEICWHYPNLKFSMEHVGGYHYFPEALAVIVNNMSFGETVPSGNVYGGLTSVFTLHQNRFWYLNEERLHELIAQAGAGQVFFGLDFPYNLEKETKMALDTIRKLNISEEEKALILGGNIRTILERV